MGADFFSDVVAGKDARTAFHSGVEQAQHEHGHGGYTGTMAEKREFMAVDIKMYCGPNMTLAKLDKWGRAVQLAKYAPSAVVQAQHAFDELKGKRTTVSMFGTPIPAAEAREMAKANLTKVKAEARKAAKAVTKLPHGVARVLDVIDRIEDDKWGAACCIEITGKAGREIKEKMGLKGTQKRIFRFSGYASS